MGRRDFGAKLPHALCHCAPLLMGFGKLRGRKCEGTPGQVRISSS
jgi:hypothetical protein